MSQVAVVIMNGNKFWVILGLLQFVPQVLWGQVQAQVSLKESGLLAQNYRSYRPVGEDEQLDLESDESLEQLMQIEYDRDAWSMSSAIGLSLVPGGGFGLIYVRKKPQAVVPFLLSSLGYGLGIAYLAGSFDESQVAVCTHARDGRVPTAECGYSSIPYDPGVPQRIDNQDIDPRSPNGQPYFQTQGDYRRSNSGRNYSGKSAGISILIATYALTSTLGAVWSGMTVRAHNRQLRRDIESTAQRSDRQEERNDSLSLSPEFAWTGDQASLGFSFQF